MEPISDRLRRYYHDIIRGRSTVRIAQPSDPPVESHPVFLVGAYRSGTTLLRLLFDSHPEFAAPPETTYLADFTSITKSSDLGGLLDMGFERSHTELKLRELAEYFYGSYAASQGKARWADKSPEYVWHLPEIARLFPTAKFVLLVRHGLDQVASHSQSQHDIQSRLLPFGSQDSDLRVAGSRYWVAAVEEQLRFLSEYPERAAMLRYEDLCANPASALTPIMQFLDSSWRDEMLEFGSKDHDFGRSDSRARTSKRIAISTGHYLGWGPEVLAACTQICTPTLRRLGWEPGDGADSPSRPLTPAPQIDSRSS